MCAGARQPCRRRVLGAQRCGARERLLAATATGRTYPDFAAKLTDGRLLVVEYNGGHLLADATAKRDRRAVAGRQRGQGGVTMVERECDGLDMRAQPLAAIG